MDLSFFWGGALCNPLQMASLLTAEFCRHKLTFSVIRLVKCVLCLCAHGHGCQPLPCESQQYSQGLAQRRSGPQGYRGEEPSFETGRHIAKGGGGPGPAYREQYPQNKAKALCFPLGDTEGGPVTWLCEAGRQGQCPERAGPSSPGSKCLVTTPGKQGGSRGCTSF